VAIYLDPDIDKIIMMEENRNKCGVYRWVNKLNKKSYVGSSTNLTSRLLDYFQIKNLIKYKTPIHSALLKYGYSNFILEILEYCEKKETILREQYYLDIILPEYNVLKIAGSSLGFKHSAETIEKMKAAHMYDNEIKLNRKLARLGFKVSEETRLKLSKISTTAIGVPVIVKNNLSNEEKHYLSLTEAAKSIGVSRTAVRKAINTKKSIKKIYSVKEK